MSAPEGCRFRAVAGLPWTAGLSQDPVGSHEGPPHLCRVLIRQIFDGDEPDGLSLREILLGVSTRWEEQD
jgi:hypothetical protein